MTTRIINSVERELAETSWFDSEDDAFANYAKRGFTFDDCAPDRAVHGHHEEGFEVILTKEGKQVIAMVYEVYH